MKLAFLAAAAILAAPAFAQTTPSTTNGIPNTPLSTSTAPSDGARAQEGNMPANSATATTPGAEPAAPMLSGPVTSETPVVAAPSPSVAEALPAPAPMDHYPMCKRGQFDHCMEPGNRR
ncbi:hypothetical protein BH09PSE4_BH09PSE4_22140 [soil metagenome]